MNANDISENETKTAHLDKDLEAEHVSAIASCHFSDLQENDVVNPTSCPQKKGLSRRRNSSNSDFLLGAGS
jgi:hypothetical protein